MQAANGGIISEAYAAIDTKALNSVTRQKG